LGEPQFLDHWIPWFRVGVEYPNPHVELGSRAIVEDPLRGGRRIEQSECLGDLVQLNRDIRSGYGCSQGEAVVDGHLDRPLCAGLRTDYPNPHAEAGEQAIA
jgi:hypothetical protein